MSVAQVVEADLKPDAVHEIEVPDVEPEEHDRL